MISLNVTGTLFIEQVIFAARGIGRRRTSVDTGEALMYMLIAAVLIAIVCAVVYLSNRMALQRRYDSQGSLFNSLCQLHGLNHNARALLKQVASQHQLAQPARVFTEPKWLDPASLKGSLSRQEAAVASLRGQLFATNGN